MHDVAAVLWASCRVGSCQKNASRELWGFAYTTEIVRKMVLGDPRLTPKVLHPSWGSLEGLFKFPVTSWVPFEIPCVSFGRLLCPLGCLGDPFGCLGGPWGLLGADYMLAPSFCFCLSLFIGLKCSISLCRRRVAFLPQNCIILGSLSETPLQKCEKHKSTLLVSLHHGIASYWCPAGLHGRSSQPGDRKGMGVWSVQRFASCF